MPEGLSKKQAEEIIEEARKRFKLVNEAEESQRKREADDLRFIVPEHQWDEEARQQRQGGNVSGINVPVPPRPMVSIPKIHQPIQMIENQEKSSRLGVRVHPLSEKANRETAHVIQGLYRKIERDSNAHQARSWAFKRAVQAGRGAYRVNLAYDEEGGHPFDMKVVIERVLHQENVFFDPSAQQPDWSDGQWAFNAAWIPADQFKREYPKASFSHKDPLEWRNVQSEAPDWVRMEGGDLVACLVAEYFYREYTMERVILFELTHEDGRKEFVPLVIPKGEKLPPEKSGLKIVKERERQVPSVKWVKMTGLDIIEAKTWQGKHIPLIPVVGRELVPFDGKRVWHGVVRSARDAQQMYNYGASSLIELAALEPRAPWILTPRQIESYEQWWAQSNTRNFPYLPYNDLPNVDKPARVQIDASRLGPSVLMLQQADDMIHSSTSMFEASLGDLPSKERSGKAIQALQQQSDAGNSDWLINLAQISMRYEAKVVLDLIPIAYERPGRVAEILEDDAGKARDVMLNIPFEDQGGQPQPSRGQGAKLFDLREGSYGTSVTIGKSYQSRLQAGGDQIGHILAQSPELMPILGAIWAKFLDIPGGEEMADVLTRYREMQFPGLGGDDGGTPEQIRAAAQRLKRENEQLKQQLQGAIKQIETDAVKAQAGLAKAKIDAGSREQVAQIESAIQMAVEKAKAASDRQMELLEQRFKARMQQLEQMHERLMQREDNISEERQAMIRKRETREGGAD